MVPIRWRCDVMSRLHTFVVILAVTSSLVMQWSIAENQPSPYVTAEIRAPPAVTQPAPADIPDEYFKTDETFTLPCNATGVPEPKYTWFKDGEEVHFRLIESTGTAGNIRVVSASTLHEGSYQCLAENKWGASLSQVFILRRIRLGSFPADKVVREFSGTIGNWLKIGRLTILSDPTPVYTWRIVNSVDDESPQTVPYSKRVLSDIEGNLYFTKLEDGDALAASEKFYKVDVFNSHMDRTIGGSYSRIIIDGTNPVPPPATLIFPETKNSSIVVLEGQPIKLNCIFGGIKSGDPDIIWSRSLSGKRSEYGTRFTIEKASLSDKGPYTCTGRNSVGTDVGTIHVIVQTIPKFTKNGRPSGRTLSEGDTAQFVCQVTKDSDPKPKIAWMINTVPIDEQAPGKRTELKNIENGKVLTITNLKRDDDIKVIQCNVSNKHRTIYADAPLNVLLRTVVTIPPEDVVFTSNVSNINFNCSAITDPSTKLKITWTRDGKPLTFYDDPNMVETKGELTLNLSKVFGEELLQYQGKYGCNASNGYSYDYKHATLYVADTPEPSGLPITAPGFSFWLIILLAGVLVLIIIFFLVCCGCCVETKKGAYYVDRNERATGNDPIEDEKVDGFQDYVRPPVARRKDSRASLTSTVFMGSMCSLNVSERGISEDGSFIGLYIDDNKRKLVY